MSDSDCVSLILIATHLIAIHRTITHKQDEAIAPQLDVLMSRIVESLRQIKLQEAVWFSARSVVAQQIELLLADDARCLLLIPDFQPLPTGIQALLQDCVLLTDLTPQQNIELAIAQFLKIAPVTFVDPQIDSPGKVREQDRILREFVESIRR
jgi:hypothetical protein